jgi:hypothetical protein
MNWTSTDDLELILHLQSGLSVEEIAKIYDCDVVSRISELKKNLRDNCYSEEQINLNIYGPVVNFNMKLEKITDDILTSKEMISKIIDLHQANGKSINEAYSYIYSNSDKIFVKTVVPPVPGLFDKFMSFFSDCVC